MQKNSNLHSFDAIMEAQFGAPGTAGKNGADCYSKNGHAVTDLTRQS